MSLRLRGLPPVVSAGTRALVLGSFPGAASLAAGQYYAHPRNHFWPIVAAITGHALAGAGYAERLAALRRHGIGLWDVYAACEREGSLDADIRAAEPNDLAGLIAQLPELALIAHNGGESARAMRVTRVLAEARGLPLVRLPSTSPANASWSFERKLAAWRAAFESAGVGAG